MTPTSRTASAVALALAAFIDPAMMRPAVAQQYLGITSAEDAAPLAEATAYSGRTRMWWTADPATHQLTGAAGPLPTTNRLHTTDPMLKQIESRCFGWGGDHGTGTGQCINTDKDGDHWFEIFFCDQEVLPQHGSFYACKGTITAIGGTGKYRNISGSGSYVEYIQTITPDGTLVGYAPGKIDLTW